MREGLLTLHNTETQELIQTLKTPGPPKALVSVHYPYEIDTPSYKGSIQLLLVTQGHKIYGLALTRLEFQIQQLLDSRDHPQQALRLAEQLSQTHPDWSPSSEVSLVS